MTRVLVERTIGESVPSMTGYCRIRSAWDEAETMWTQIRQSGDKQYDPTLSLLSDPHQRFGNSSQGKAIEHDRREGQPVQVGVMAFPNQQPQTVELILSGIQESGCVPKAIHPGVACPGSPASWPLIVVYARQITGDVLTGISHAAYELAARVLTVAEDRDPRVIADVLRCGADDYLAYPFAPEEFKARIQSLIRHAQHMNDRRQTGQITFDFPSRTISAGSRHISLSKQEWRILIALLEAEGSPVDAGEISRIVPGDAVSSSNLASTVSRLRRKLQRSGFSVVYIDTVRGKGYAARFRRSSDTFQRSRINY